MTPTSELNALGQIYENQFIQAWQFFEDDQFCEANSISRRLILEPAISNLHKAGCHFILAHSPDDYVYHAEQAVALFKDMYPGSSSPPDAEQKRGREELVRSAEAVLEEARADAKQYAINSNRSESKDAVSKRFERTDTARLRSILHSRRSY